MSEKHTQGRLEVTNQRFIRFSDGQRHVVARVTRPNSESINETEEIARRLVACWNLCDGIATEQIERFGPSMLYNAGYVMAQRDELLAALEGVMYWDNGKPEWDVARAAIAKVKGGAA